MTMSQQRWDCLPPRRAILAAARKQREFKAKPYQQFWMSAPSDWKCPRILALGAGARRDYSSDRARRLAMAGGHAARNRNLGRVAFVQRGIGSSAGGGDQRSQLTGPSSTSPKVGPATPRRRPRTPIRLMRRRSSRKVWCCAPSTATPTRTTSRLRVTPAR